VVIVCDKCTRVLTFEAGVCFEKAVAIRETLLGHEDDATKVCPLYGPYMSLIYHMARVFKKKHPLWLRGGGSTHTHTHTHPHTHTPPPARARARARGRRRRRADFFGVMI
jgi:hypothetical protein